MDRQKIVHAALHDPTIQGSQLIDRGPTSNRYNSKVTINPSIKMAIRGFIDEKGDFVGICIDGVAKFS